MVRKTVSILGGGPSAMLLAATLDPVRYEVHIYERNAAPGRKFLVAGQGGFNLTHAEPIGAMVERYTPSGFLKQYLLEFNNEDLRHWLQALGVNTYVGTSQRVFPVKGIKPVEVLNAILSHLKLRGVHLHLQHEWKGFEGDALVFNTPQGKVSVKADITVFALGGCSWKVTGSDGSWVSYLQDKHIECLPFQASNCAFAVDWPQACRQKIEGQALKNAVFRCGEQSRTGEAVMTEFGIEGSGIYPLSPQIREQLQLNGFASVWMDLKPAYTVEKIAQLLDARHSGNITTVLEKEIRLSRPVIALLKAILSRDVFMEPAALAEHIKGLEIRITALGPVDDAISTTGGIALHEVTAHFELKKLPHHYAIGEMLDWDAPTGGYLLQAAFSMGVALGRHLNRQL